MTNFRVFPVLEFTTLLWTAFNYWYSESARDCIQRSFLEQVRDNPNREGLVRSVDVHREVIRGAIELHTIPLVFVHTRNGGQHGRHRRVRAECHTLEPGRDVRRFTFESGSKVVVPNASFSFIYRLNSPYPVLKNTKIVQMFATLN